MGPSCCAVYYRLTDGTRIFWYFFGGFGSLLFVAALLCFIAWYVSASLRFGLAIMLSVLRRPLGDPNPSVSNLALAVVILIVVVLQAGFVSYISQAPL